MTGMDMLLASLTPEHLEKREVDDLVLDAEAMQRWSEEFFAVTLRWLIEDLEKRIRE